MGKEIVCCQCGAFIGEEGLLFCPICGFSLCGLASSEDEEDS